MTLFGDNRKKVVLWVSRNQGPRPRGPADNDISIGEAIQINITFAIGEWFFSVE